MRDDASFLEFEGNTVTGSALAPLFLENPHALSFIGAGDYTGSGEDAIALGGGTRTRSAIWRDLEVPIALEGDLSLSGGAILTLERGVELRFAPVGFTAQITGAGGLGGGEGIQIGPETGPATAFTNCRVGNGGDDGFGNFHLTDRPWITITGCTIRASAPYGIYLEGTADDPDYRNFLLQNDSFDLNAFGDIGP